MIPTYPLQWVLLVSPLLARAPTCLPRSSPSAARSPVATAAGHHKTSTPWSNVPYGTQLCVCSHSRAEGCLVEKEQWQEERKQENKKDRWRKSVVVGEKGIFIFVHVLCFFFLNKRTCIPHIMWVTCVCIIRNACCLMPTRRNNYRNIKYQVDVALFYFW